MKGKHFIFALIFSLLFLNLTSAQDWTMYGNSYTPMWHEEFGGNKGNLLLNYNLTISNGYNAETSATTPFQPIVLESGSANYLVFPSANYLELYDGNLNLLSEVLSGLSVGQVASMDFNRDGSSDDIYRQRCRQP